MNLEKWQSIVGKVKDKFDIEDEGKQHLEDEGGVDVDYIVFTSPVGKIRLELVIKPVVLDKKTTYSRRIGSETKVDYIYSDEKSYKLYTYKWDVNDNDWLEIESNDIIN